MASSAAVEIQTIQCHRSACRPAVTAAALVCSDAVAILIAWCAAVLVRVAAGEVLELSWYVRLTPGLLVLLAGFAVCGLYPGCGIGPVEEMRRLIRVTTALYINLVLITFLLRDSAAYSRVTFVTAWVLSIVLLPIARAIVRRIGGSLPWWGASAVLLGTGRSASAVVSLLHSDPGLGIRIEAVVSETTREGTVFFQGIPVVGGLDNLLEIVRNTGIRRAIIAESPNLSVAEAVRASYRYFPNLLVIPEVFGPVNLCVEARGLGDMLTLGVHQKLLMRGPRIYKRAVDLIICTIGILALLPLFFAIACAIRFTSAGPVFYGHTRIGKHRKNFKAWKFRTMVVNADEVLEERLHHDASLREEWKRHHKLRRDPRVTAIGRLLRKLSLDELPQLWNVLCGQMSLVGPRPIVTEEIPLYGDQFDIYSHVLPGLSGLWQVSGRNNTTYERRVELDCYYVYNWSPWLDLYILARTFGAVVEQRGAY